MIILWVVDYAKPGQKSRLKIFERQDDAESFGKMQ